MSARVFPCLASGRRRRRPGNLLRAGVPALRRFLLPPAACLLAAVLSLPSSGGPAAAAEADEAWTSGTFSGLALRGIGPAIGSGRVGDFAVDPRNPFHYYVAVCSGGVWETRNGGVTYTPIFDDQGSYSIGCLALAPSDPNVVWVGTGENNSQRSVGFGDGIYRSPDGGKTWQNMGLARSMHIGRIIVHPTDPDVVYAAALGPLWGPGGDRGVYKTQDGGRTWQQVLAVDQDTGAVDLVMDPRDPQTLYAASYQRRRHQWVLIDGGPGSGIHKSVDGGATWTKLKGGLPEVDLGRIGLAIPPTSPDTVYAIVEAAQGKGGFFRSRDGGASWEKMSDFVAGSPQYYNELIPDPRNPDRVYAIDTFLRVTEDGGKTWRRLSVRSKHVDDHAVWVDPERTEHLRSGCDGGIYESYDRGETWHFAANLPVTQFYRVAVDEAEPFYNVYGGTQDNNTIGGPSRTTFGHGLSNREWFFLLGGDGFKPAVDPTNPDIVYCQWQHGNLHRYDRRSGEVLDIQPQPEQDAFLKWHWNSPLIISPHDHRRLYYACQTVFRSDDMGNSWRPVSGDLSAGIDRNTLPVMGRVWSVDAVAKNNSTSFWGTVVSLAESPVQEGLLLAGTDDGLIQISGDGGATWRRQDRFPGVPERTLVSDLEPSRFDAQVIFASFDNHKMDDFRPYVLKSEDGGRSWRSIAGDLPERGPVHSLAQDHVDPDLLFAGTEFGLFFTRDGGKSWVQLKGGLPVIPCQDLEIQRRESDLAVATFGRGFYILDDYSPLRGLTPQRLQEEAVLFPIKDALIYVPGTPIGDSGKGSQGDDFYTAPNPPFGAVLTYHLRDGYRTLQDERREAEKKKFEAGEPVHYPPWDELRAEDREHDPQVIVTIKDEAGRVVRRFDAPADKGLHRVAWDLRLPDVDPIDLDRAAPQSPWDPVAAGPLAAPGTYTASLSKRVRGQETHLAGPVTFHTRLLGNNTTLVQDYAQLAAFQEQANELYRAVQGASRTAQDAQARLDHMRKAVDESGALGRDLRDRIDALEIRLKDLLVALDGDATVTGRSEPAPPGIAERVSRIRWSLRDVTSAPTQTMRQSLEIAGRRFGPLLQELRTLVTVQIADLERQLEQAKAPYTPGRIPVWEER